MRPISTIRLALAVLLCAFALATGAAYAQSNSGAKPVPTVPGASSAANGGYTSSQMSTGRASAIGPLEPYLVTLLIPVFGLIALGFSVFVDKKLRRQGHGGL